MLEARVRRVTLRLPDRVRRLAIFGRMWRSTLVALALLGALAAPAQATVRKGTGSDPAGDQTGANAGNDIIAAAAQADDAAGQAGIAIGLSAPPASYVLGVLGTRSGTECGPPFVLFLGRPATGAAVYGRESATAPSDFKPAQMSVDGSTVTFAAADAAQLALPFDCAEAATSPDGDTRNLYDATDAFVALAADAPPAATPTPTPTVAPQPPTTKASVPPVPVPKTAKLTATLGGVPSTIKRNRTITLKLVLADDGAKATRPITVTLAPARGVSLARRTLKTGKLKPAQRRTLKLRVKLTGRARVSTTLRVSVRAGTLKATSSVLLRIGKAKKAPAAPGTKKGPLVGTYWWRTVNHADYAWDNRAFYFVDDRTVYSGLPEAGLPASCTAPPAKPAEEIDKRDGCLPYAYDAKTGALTIGDKTGTYKPGTRLVLDGNPYSATQIPAAGARYSFADHEHFDFEGFCGLVTGCTVTKKFLTLTPDGQFVLSHSTTATMGDPGLGPFTAVGSYPPDQHGTYEVLAGGRIHLAFADGTSRDDTFAVLTKDDTLQPDPVGEGVFVGVDNYYPDPFP